MTVSFAVSIVGGASQPDAMAAGAKQQIVFGGKPSVVKTRLENCSLPTLTSIRVFSRGEQTKIAPLGSNVCVADCAGQGRQIACHAVKSACRGDERRRASKQARRRHCIARESAESRSINAAAGAGGENSADHVRCCLRRGAFQLAADSADQKNFPHWTDDDRRKIPLQRRRGRAFAGEKLLEPASLRRPEWKFG